MSAFYSSWMLDYPNRERMLCQIGNKRRAGRHRGCWDVHTSDQEETVSVWACMSVLVREKRRGRKRAIACVQWRISVSLSAYKFICLCPVMCVYVCGCTRGRMCAECDVCRQCALMEKFTGIFKFSRRTADSTKTNLFLCLFGSSWC